MPDIHIHRPHQLGLPKAREVATQWVGEVEKKFGMECTVIVGDGSDTVEFKRSGVSGTVVVAGDHFELNARLGFLMGAFSKVIEAEIEKNFDGLLASHLATGKPGRATAAPASLPSPTVSAGASSANKAASRKH